jgi:glutamine synthetase
VPTAYSSWAGDALDQKIPLLRSIHSLNRVQVKRALALFGVKADRIRATLGPEQEFFLVDQEFFYRRADLLTTGRTLFGAQPPKGQELEDHYFGAIPDRVLEYMQEVEEELYRLGCPSRPGTTRWPPGSSRWRRCTRRRTSLPTTSSSSCRRSGGWPSFGLVCLLHEKPFPASTGAGST